MPYLVVDDFSTGIDLRKSTVTSKQGTLRELRNAFVTAGGEIEKRKTLTLVSVLPAGATTGLAFRDNQIVVFGTAAAPGSLPPYTTYEQLVPDGGGVTITRVLDVAPFGSTLYVIAKFSDGSVRHFADGTEIVAMRNNGTAARAHKAKMHVVDGSNLRFSAINDPDDFAGTGSGIIDVTTHDTGTPTLVGLEPYYGLLALLGRTSVQLWSIDPDPAMNTIQQTLGNIGLVAPNAVSRYGNGDILFLSDTGVRSLRARDSSNAAVLNDIGSPIDKLIGQKRAILTPADAEKITALVDPLTGQFWLVWGNEVHVLSYYPNSKITAWSTFELPWTPDHVVLANSRILLRKGDEIFVYGSVPPSGSPLDPNAPLGTSAALYDATTVTVVTSMLDVQKPATNKNWQGIDLAVQGLWDVYVAPDYANPDVWTKIATVSAPTFGDHRVPLNMTSTHLSLKLVSQGTGFASISAVNLHFEGGSQD